MTLDDMKQILNVDYTDDDTYIQSLIDASQAYVDKCCGEDYKTDDKLLKLSDLAVQKLVNDMYDNRSSYLDNTQVQKDKIIMAIFQLLSSAEAVDDEIS